MVSTSMTSAMRLRSLRKLRLSLALLLHCFVVGLCVLPCRAVNLGNILKRRPMSSRKLEKTDSDVEASADEARQAFSDVRTGSPYDVLIDVAGGVVMVLGLLVISKRLRPSNTVESSA